MLHNAINREHDGSHHHSTFTFFFFKKKTQLRLKHQPLFRRLLFGLCSSPSRDARVFVGVMHLFLPLPRPAGAAAGLSKQLFALHTEAAKQWHNYTIGHFQAIRTATYYEYSGVDFAFVC